MTKKKWLLLLDHCDPENPIIVKDCDPSKIKREVYIFEIDPIQPGKKTLIANDDESAYECVKNVTDDEWENILKDAYDDDDKEECGPCGIYYDEEDFPETLEDFINDYNDQIEDSYVNGDSACQFRWYTDLDALTFEEYKDEFEDDEDFDDNERR